MNRHLCSAIFFYRFRLSLILPHLLHLLLSTADTIFTYSGYILYSLVSHTLICTRYMVSRDKTKKKESAPFCERQKKWNEHTMTILAAFIHMKMCVRCWYITTNGCCLAIVFFSLFLSHSFIFASIPFVGSFIHIKYTNTRIPIQLFFASSSAAVVTISLLAERGAVVLFSFIFTFLFIWIVSATQYILVCMCVRCWSWPHSQTLASHCCCDCLCSCCYSRCMAMQSDGESNEKFVSLV